MPDPRIEQLADVLVNYSVAVQPGDQAMLMANTLAEPLLRAAYLKVLRAGGHPLVLVTLPDLEEWFLRHGSDEQLQFVPGPVKLAMETYGARIGMVGSSRGGLMTYRALTRSDRMKAAVVLSGISDLASWYSSRPDVREALQSLVGGDPHTARKAYRARSPVLWPKRLCKSTPILILHGAADLRVPAGQALRMAAALLRVRHPFRLALLEGAGHSLVDCWDDHLALMRAWLDRFVRDGAPLPRGEPHDPWQRAHVISAQEKKGRTSERRESTEDRGRAANGWGTAMCGGPEAWQEVLMAEMALAVCGLDCGECRIFQARNSPEIAESIVAWFREERKIEVRPEQIRCPGCRGDQAEHWTPGCSILQCCQGKGLEYCSDCGDLPCARLVERSQGSPRYAEALSRLQQMKSAR